MAITVVQTASSTVNPPYTFTVNVTAGNTVFLVVGAYTNASATITSSNPKFAGSTVSNAVAFFNPGAGNGVMSPLNGTNGVYLTIWMLPALGGGSNSVDLTVSGQSGITGAVLLEVNGLGNVPVQDKASHGSSGTTTAVDSGASGGITVASEFVLGAGQIFAGSAAGPAGYTNTSPVANTWAGWQVSTVAGTSYDWAQTGNSGNPWSAGVVTVAASLTTPAPFYPVTRIKARLPVPLLTGRKIPGGPGVPAANPGVVPVYGALPGAVRACLPVNLRGRVVAPVPAAVIPPPPPVGSGPPLPAGPLPNRPAFQVFTAGWRGTGGSR